MSLQQQTKADNFERVRSRWLIAIFLIGLPFGYLVVPDVYPALQEVIGDLFILLSLYLFCRIYGVKIKQIVGRPNGLTSLLRPVLLVVPPLFMLSVGLILVTSWLLSYAAPAFVETWILSVLNADEALPFIPATVILVLTWTAVPIYEEFLFRGLLLHRWSQKWGVTRGIVFSSLVFGVLHFDLLGAFIFGYVMCVLYLWTKTLLVPILAHALNNFIAGAPGLVDAVRGGEPAAALTLADLRSEWLLGIACLAVSIPWLLIYLRSKRVSNTFALPYEANAPEISP